MNSILKNKKYYLEKAFSITATRLVPNKSDSKNKKIDVKKIDIITFSVITNTLLKGSFISTII